MNDHNKKHIQDTILPYKKNGVGTLASRDIMLFVLNEISDIKNKVVGQITFCKSHLAAQEVIAKSNRNMIATLISLAAVAVSIFALFKSI